jgi:hypothetical protein
MSMKARNVVLFVAYLSTVACFGGSGTTCTGDEPIVRDPNITVIDPCKANVGEDITITGSNFFSTQNSGYVRIGGVIATVKSWSGTKIVATVPAGTTDGVVTVTNSDSGSSNTDKTLIIGPRTAVPENEPNDSINGSNATDTGYEQTGSGALSDVGDKDHFMINCLFAHAYTLTLTPRVVGVVYVDGVAVPLDNTGKAIISGLGRPNGRILVGLTGGTGSYTISVR